MNTPSEGPTRNAQATGGAELEQEYSSLHEELTEGRAGHSPVPEEEEQVKSQKRPRSRRSSRRKMLTKGMGMAAVASVGAGALLELSSGIALAAPPEKSGAFASSTAGTPAVGAMGTNGADGVDASSDSGTGVSVTSTSGTALVAKSSSGLAGHFTGNVTMDNNLTVTSALSTGTLSSGAGTFASSVSTTPAIKASGIAGADGMNVSSDSGNGILGASANGNGIFGTSTAANHAGVVGVNANTNGTGVSGASTNGTGVSGFSTNSTGVFGFSTNSTGVFGEGNPGVVGFSNSSSGLAGLFDGNVQVNGNFSATGTKAFVQAHPTDPSREIVYVALEGGEAGTYVRGSGQLQGGKAVLALSEHFGLVTDNEGLTVQLTPRGEWLQLYVVELDTAQLVVREAQGKSGAFDYLIHGVRRGYEQYEVIRMKP